ncbi:MAG TPA: hypothetical protein VK358_06030 [Longimicrobium sp.]|nr:hypothetical protein [Longimicrobium sp.]
MRITRSFAVALAAALLSLAAAPSAASAQRVERTMTHPAAERNAAQQAAFDALNADLNALFTAQRAFFTEHGRYAATLAELPGFTARPEAHLVLTSGADWYVAKGGDAEAGTMQHVVYRGEQVPAEATEAARAESRAASSTAETRRR